jgi:hypothetical protein
LFQNMPSGIVANETGVCGAPGRKGALVVTG